MRRFFRVAGGFALLGAGLIMTIPGVPGPGILTIILGLVVLAEHYHWARRLLAWAKSKIPHRKDAGRGGEPKPQVPRKKRGGPALPHL